MSNRLGRALARSPWVWPYGGVLLLWLLIGLVASRLTVATLTSNAVLAALLAVVAVGQMLVITGGGGGIDLSIPFVMTLSGFLATGIMNGRDAALLPGVTAGIGIGVAAGIVNATIILGFGIPPIVATLATGFIADSATNVYSSAVATVTPSPSLAGVVHGSVLGVPWLAVAALLLVLAAGGLLHETVPGRHLEATGQSQRAAVLSGIGTGRVRAGSYVASGALAGFGGVLLAGYSGGAFLRMGDPYLLASIGAVVVGGSSIAGGRSTAAGVFGGALFLTLGVTLMEVSRLAIGLQYALEGVLIIVVLMVASRGRG